MPIIRLLSCNLIKHYFKINRFSTLSPKRVFILKDLNRSIINERMSCFQFSSLSELKVEHNLKGHQFYVQLGKDRALLSYRDVSPGVVDLYHTEVPQELQGKGIAKLLAQEAFDYVVKNNLKMRISCTYLQKFIKENPKPEYLKQEIK